MSAMKYRVHCVDCNRKILVTANNYTYHCDDCKERASNIQKMLTDEQKGVIQQYLRQHAFPYGEATDIMLTYNVEFDEWSIIFKVAGRWTELGPARPTLKQLINLLRKELEIK